MIVIYIVLSLLLAVFIYFHLYPYILDKIMFWKVERMLRKIAKKSEDKDLADQINNVADIAKKCRKETEL